MILSQAIIFVLGWPLEWTEIIVIFVPIFLPLLKHFNIDPILWGTLVFVNLQAAFLSPPVAMSAFYLKGVAPSHVTLNQIFAGMMPYMKEYGKHPAQRACAAADRTGHALLHTLYQQCLKHKVEFYVEYFVLDLIMS